jgi:hypothetical protein
MAYSIQGGNTKVTFLATSTTGRAVRTYLLHVQLAGFAVLSPLSNERVFHSAGEANSCTPSPVFPPKAMSCELGSVRDDQCCTCPSKLGRRPFIILDMQHCARTRNCFGTIIMKNGGEWHNVIGISSKYEHTHILTTHDSLQRQLQSRHDSHRRLNLAKCAISSAANHMRRSQVVGKRVCGTKTGTPRPSSRDGALVSSGWYAGATPVALASYS